MNDERLATGIIETPWFTVRVEDIRGINLGDSNTPMLTVVTHQHTYYTDFLPDRDKATAMKAEWTQAMRAVDGNRQPAPPIPPLPDKPSEAMATAMVEQYVCSINAGSSPRFAMARAYNAALAAHKREHSS